MFLVERDAIFGLYDPPLNLREKKIIKALRKKEELKVIDCVEEKID